MKNEKKIVGCVIPKTFFYLILTLIIDYIDNRAQKVKSRRRIAEFFQIGTFCKTAIIILENRRGQNLLHWATISLSENSGSVEIL